MGNLFSQLQQEAEKQQEQIREAEAEAPSPPPVQAPTRKGQLSLPKKQPSNRDTTPPRHHAIKKPLAQDSQTEIMTALRRAVRELGKEAATYRFTRTEKDALADIVYTYKRQGIRTSENEITRIAVNYLIQDFHRNGENSLLAQAIKELNS